MDTKKKKLDLKFQDVQEKQKQSEEDIDSNLLNRFKELTLEKSECFTEYVNHDKRITKLMQKNVDFKLEDFEILEVLGQGASGKVSKVKHKQTGKFYAMKEIKLNNDEHFQKQLIWEIKTLFACNSQYIVQYYCAFYVEGILNIILEYMDQGTLDSILKKSGKVNETIVKYVTYQILKGIQYLHKELKIIHRDIKPGNVLVNSQGEIKISDLGICGQVSGTLDQKNTFVGTTIYMSPERLSGEGYTIKTDIWSLGLLLIELSEGRHPIDVTQNKNFFDVLNSIKDFKLPQFHNINSNEFIDLIQKCLEVDQNKRSDINQLIDCDFVKSCKGKTSKLRPVFIEWISLHK